MAFIKVWCEYDISGNFGGNYEDVFEVEDNLTSEQISDLVEDKYSYLFDDVKDEEDESFLATGLLAWEYVHIEKLGDSL